MEVFRLVGRIVTEGLDSTSSGLGKVGKAFDNAGARAQQFGRTVGAAGAAVGGAGAGMTATITAPLAAVGAAAITAANDTQTATGRIQAQLGLSSAEAEKLAGTAQNLWTQGFGADVGEAADAVAIVGQNMQGLDPSQIETATRHAMTFSEAFGEDVTASTAAASVMMKNFGIDSTESFDLMTVAMQKGGNYSGELLDTMREYSPQFAAMGMSADDMMNTLISGAEAGAFNLDKVGDAVKEFNLLAGGEQSEATAAAFKTIGLDAAQMGNDIAGGGEKAKAAYNATIAGLANMENAQDRNIAGVALFGTQWEDLQADVVTAMSTSVNHIGKVEGATDKAGAALRNNFGDQMRQAWRELSVALQPLGVMLMDLAMRALPVVQTKIEQLTNWFGSLTATQQKWIVILGVAAAAAGPLLMVLGSLMGAIGTVITVGGTLLRFFTQINSSMKLVSKGGALLRGAFQFIVGAARGLGIALRFLALTPMGLVITTITALVAGALYLYRNWETIGPKLSAVWQRVKDATVRTVSSMWTSVTGFFSRMGTSISTTMSRISTWIANAWTNSQRRTHQIIMNLVNGVLQWFANMGSRALQTITNFINRAITNFNNLRSRAISTITQLVNQVITWFNNLRTRSVQTFNNLLTSVISTLTNLRNRAEQLARTVVNNLINAWNNLRTRTATLFGNLKDDAIKKIGSLATEAGKIPGKIGTAISNAASDATGAIKTLADNLVKKFKSALGINSPSKVFEGMGGHIIDGLANGLSSANLKDWGLEMFGDFAGGALNSLEAIKGFFSGGWTGGGGAGAAAAAGWIRQAMAITGVGESWFGPLMTTAKKESGFNPRAINLWDSNFLAGHPSKGLFQTIPTTFAAHKLPGLNDLWNPVHNAVAAIRYMQSRYGSVFNIPGIRNMAAGGAYAGYEKGGIFTGPSTIRIAETSNTPVEAAVPLAGRYMHPFSDAIADRIVQKNGGNSGGGSVRIVVDMPVQLDGREIARVITPEIDAQLEANRQKDLRARGKRG